MLNKKMNSFLILILSIIIPSMLAAEPNDRQEEFFELRNRLNARIHDKDYPLTPEQGGLVHDYLGIEEANLQYGPGNFDQLIQQIEELLSKLPKVKVSGAAVALPPPPADAIIISPIPARSSRADTLEESLESAGARDDDSGEAIPCECVHASGTVSLAYCAICDPQNKVKKLAETMEKDDQDAEGDNPQDNEHKEKENDQEDQAGEIKEGGEGADEACASIDENNGDDDDLRNKDQADDGKKDGGGAEDECVPIKGNDNGGNQPQQPEDNSASFRTRLCIFALLFCLILN